MVYKWIDIYLNLKRNKRLNFLCSIGIWFGNRIGIKDFYKENRFFLFVEIILEEFFI